MNFWEMVDSELEYRNINRKQLASEAGFNVSNISNGIRKNNIPLADTAVRIAQVLGVSVEYLVTGKPAQFSDATITYEVKLFQKYRDFIQKLEHLSPAAQEGMRLLVEKLAES